MTYHKLGAGFRGSRSQSKAQNPKSKIACALLFTFSILLFIGCGEKENKNLVNARELIQQGKFKESEDITGLRSELDLSDNREQKQKKLLFRPPKGSVFTRTGPSFPLHFYLLFLSVGLEGCFLSQSVWIGPSRIVDGDPFCSV